MHITFDIKRQGDTEPTRVTAGAADYLALEERFDLDLSVLQDRQRLTWFAFLAWSALFRAKQITEPFDAWSQTLDTIEVVDDAGESQAIQPESSPQ